MKIVVVLLAVSMTACLSEPPAPPEWQEELSLGAGNLVGMVFDDAGPILAFEDHLVRREAGVWTTIPGSTWHSKLGALQRGPSGTLYAQDAEGIPLRWSLGATAWEPLRDASQAPFQGLPIEGDDGTLFVLGTDQPPETPVTPDHWHYMVYTRAPGATQWVAGMDLSSTGDLYLGRAVRDTTLVAEPDGWVWFEGPGRDGELGWRVRGEELVEVQKPAEAEGLRVASVAPNGDHLYVETDYTIDIDDHWPVGVGGPAFPEVVRWNPVTGEHKVVSVGGCHEHDVYTLTCIDGVQPRGVGYVYPNSVGADAKGNLYALWADDNGAYPYLIKLAVNDDRWRIVTDAGQPWLAAGVGAINLAVGPDASLYILVVFFMGGLSTTGETYNSGFTSYLYALH